MPIYLLDADTRAKFWSHVERTSGCWFWIGTLNRGVPQFSVRYPGGRSVVQAARYAYAAEVEELPDRILVLRRCGQPTCVRPDHLTIGTQHNLDRWGPERREAQFWSFVDSSGGPDACWSWQGHINAWGYGQTCYRGHNTTANRIACELAHGAAPPRRHACHHCDNPPCCNPAHLYWGTPRDNAQDRERRKRGRSLPGHLNATAKLTPDQVREVRQLSDEGWTYRELGERFGLHWQNIGRIVRGVGYRNVS